MTDQVAAAVTALFVPGDRPDRYANAASAGADVVIIDLEDAVAPDEKDEARRLAIAALRPSPDGPGLMTMIRINALGTSAAAADIAALGGLLDQDGHGLIGIVVPKVEDSDALADLITTLAAPLAVVGLIESARGVADLAAIARTPGLTRLAFGARVLAADLGIAPDSPTVEVARAQLVIASRAAGLPPPLDSPSVEIRATERVLAAARRARQSGFGGLLCIHPAQLGAVRTGFAPTPEEIAWAETIIDAGEAAIAVDGRMIDRPVLLRARRILDAVERTDMRS